MHQSGSPWEKLKEELILGTDTFVASVQELIGKKEEIPEIPRLQRHVGRPALEVVFPHGGVGAKEYRNAAIVEAHLKHGHTLKEMADHIGIHYTSVSKIIRSNMTKK